MRHGSQTLLHRFAVGAITLLGLLGSSTFAGDQPAKPAMPAAPAREALRYGGKPFAYWRDRWRTELKAGSRIEALEALAAFGQDGYGKEATAVILEILQHSDVERFAYSFAEADAADPDGQVVRKAGWALDKIGEAGLPVIVGCLYDSHPALRGYAFDRLRAAGHSKVPKTIAAALVRATKQRDPEIAGLAAELFLEGDGPDCALSVVLRSPEQTAELISALARLVALSPSEPESEERVASAAMLLADIGPAGKAAIPALTKGWRAPGQPANCRVASALALAALRAEPAKTIPQFRAALCDKDELVRTAAARALGMYGTDARAAVPTLRHALKDQQACVRLAALLALGKIENNPHHTLDDFVAASQVANDADSLADHLDTAAKATDRLSEAWLEALRLRSSGLGTPANYRFRMVEAHANIAPAVRQALPIIKEAVRRLSPAGSAISQQAGPGLLLPEAASRPAAKADVARAIAAALKKVPLEPAPASER